MFVVDSADKVRLDEAQYELSQILQSRYLSKVPIVVVANKQDAEGEKCHFFILNIYVAICERTV